MRRVRVEGRVEEGFYEDLRLVPCHHAMQMASLDTYIHLVAPLTSSLASLAR